MVAEMLRGCLVCKAAYEDLSRMALVFKRIAVDGCTVLLGALTV